MATLHTAIRAAVYGIAFILLWGWLALSVRGYDTNIPLSLPSWTPVVGLVLMVSGGILVLVCVAMFVAKGHGTQAPFDPPKEFVVVGPYKYVRNPIYVGGSFLLLGFGLTHRSVSMILFCLLASGLTHLFVVFVEEKGLERRFGSAYREYKQTVNRWLPKIADTSRHAGKMQQ